jgi:hypothetical protein
MKTALACCLAFFAVASTQAQVFRPTLAHRSGPVVTASVGYAHHHHPASYFGHRGYTFGHGYYGRAYYTPVFGYYDGYGYGYPYYDYGYYGGGSAATNGLLLGALAGGIIGHNSGSLHHNGWRGAAWGAGAGLLLGSVIDANRRPVVYQTAPALVPSAPAVQGQIQTAQQTQPQPVTIINNYYNSASPMSEANSLFGR